MLPDLLTPYLIPGIEPYHVEESGIIYCADCRDILPHLPKVDLVLTDPPYGIGLDYGTFKDNPNGYFEWFNGLINEFRKLADSVVFTHRQSSLKYIFDWDWLAIWQKPMAFGHRIGKWLPHWEPIYIYGTPSEFSPDVFSHCTESPKRIKHPAPKPLTLFLHLLSIYKQSNIILDPFLGSGTSAVAAKELGRKFIGIEISEEYCKIAVKRLRQGVLNFE